MCDVHAEFPTGVLIMTLAFPNPSRSFDEARNAVRFFGHDGLFEVRFFVEVDALAKSNPWLRRTGMSEATCLSVFDSSCTPIHNVAREVYSKASSENHRVKFWTRIRQVLHLCLTRRFDHYRTPPKGRGGSYTLTAAHFR